MRDGGPRRDGEVRRTGLESLAQRVLARFPTVEDPIRLARRPFFVELAGTPKSGKSTTAARLAHFLRRNHFRVRLLPEPASICPLAHQDHLAFNTWATCTTLIEMLQAVERDEQIVLLDRGLFDALCWTHWLARTGRLSAAERRTVDEFVALDCWRQWLDLVFVFTADPDTAIEREVAGQLTDRAGRIMNRTTLQQLNESIAAVRREREGAFRAMVAIDTTGSDARQTLEQVTAVTLQHMQEFLRDRVLVLEKDALRDQWPSDGPFVAAPDAMARVLRLVSTAGRFLDRATAERSARFVQPIPMAYFEHGDQYLLLRCRDPDLGDRAGEECLLWVGGHLRPEDHEDGDAVERCLLREVREELYLRELPRPAPVGLLLDAPSLAAARHLGIVHAFRVDRVDVATALDRREFRETRGLAVRGEWATRRELAARAGRMDAWSRAILAECLGETRASR
ncbi:MAG TPA: hypothetical protein VFE37_30180 [Chloroflexota bacterium]|nr:hypothetical protein [Chloroflexota bacterium]